MTLVSSVSAMTDVEERDRDLLQALQQAEKARLELAQRLVNAQEAECRRVGQELHDSIGHTLAMLTIDLERTRRSLTDQSPKPMRDWLVLLTNSRTLATMFPLCHVGSTHQRWSSWVLRSPSRP